MAKKLLKYFLLITIFISFNYKAYASELFQVEVSLLYFQENLNKQQAFGKALNSSANTLLVRLSATPDINNTVAGRVFLQNPRSWLESYNYRPVMSEGVEIGQKIIFNFNQSLVSKFLQNNNITIWHFQQRPKTLVFGSQKLGGTVTNIKSSNINNLPTLDFRTISKQLALPIKTPTIKVSDNLWVTPQAQISANTLARLSNLFLADYILTFQEYIALTGNKTFNWKLYSANGSLVLRGKESNRLAIKNIENMFSRLLSFYAKPYLKQSLITNSVTLTISAVDEFIKFATIKKELQNISAITQRVRLTRLENNAAIFNIQFNGSLSDLLSQINRIDNLTVLSDAFSQANITAVWLP